MTHRAIGHVVLHSSVCVPQWMTMDGCCLEAGGNTLLWKWYVKISSSTSQAADVNLHNATHPYFLCGQEDKITKSEHLLIAEGSWLITRVNESDPAHTLTGNSFKTRVHQQTWWMLLIRRAHLCPPPREIWCNNCGMCGTILDLSCLHWPAVHCYSTWLQLTILHIALLLRLKCTGGQHVVLISALWGMWPFLCV